LCQSVEELAQLNNVGMGVVEPAASDIEVHRQDQLLSIPAWVSRPTVLGRPTGRITHGGACLLLREPLLQGQHAMFECRDSIERLDERRDHQVASGLPCE
jgi:hypothetical protein